MDTRIGYRDLLRRSFALDDARRRARVEDAIRRDPKIALAAEAIELAFALPEAAAFDPGQGWAALQERLQAAEKPPVVRLIHPKRRRSLAPLAAAASVVLVLLGGWFALDRLGVGAAAAEWGLVASAPVVNLAGVHDYRLGDGASIRLSGNTHLVPEMLERGEAAEPAVLARGRFRLERGRLDAEVRPGAFASFAVVTRHAEVLVVGTRFTVEAKEAETIVSVEAGTVRVSRPGGEGARELSAGKRLICRAEGVYTPEELAERIRQEKERAAHAERIKQEAAEFSEKVFLDDGTVFTGRILAQDAAGLRIRTRHGTFTIPRERITRVVYK
jgi:ferric-dicitrate binding protein FerR (iron transport regulator)